MFRLLSSGIIPDDPPIDHREFLALRSFRIPSSFQHQVDWTDYAFLEDYGHYLEALDLEEIAPANIQQGMFCSDLPTALPTINHVIQIWGNLNRSLMLDRVRYRIYDPAQSWVPHPKFRQGRDWGMGA